jgi:hypothetical protein
MTKALMKKLPYSVEEGVGGGADCDFMFSVSGDNHPGAERATPPESGGEDFPRMPHSTYSLPVNL